MSADTLRAVAYLIVGLAIGLVVHEYAHAALAVRLGDQTPRQAGRLTLDPRPHVDPFGTLLLPGILLLVVLFGGSPIVFAYAKPQPLNPWALRRQDHHMVYIALAGPIANVALAFVFGALLRLGVAGAVGDLVGACVLVNVTLAAMNLMPIPPLDGAKVVARFLAPRAREVYANLEQYGALFMLLIFFILPGPIFYFVGIIADGICRVTVGHGCPVV